MSTKPEMLQIEAKGRPMAALVLIVGLAATCIGVLRERELARRDQVILWQEAYAQLQPVLFSHLNQPFEVLQEVAKATVRRENFSAAGWADFLAESDWRDHFPGMMEIGYAELAGDQCTVKYLDSRRALPGHTPGYDLNSNPVVRAAVQKCADAGIGHSAHEATFGQGPAAAQAVMGLLPLPVKNQRPGTAAENRANVKGFVFFALNQADFLRSFQPQLNSLLLALKLLPDDEPAPPRTDTQRVITTDGVSGEWRFAATMKAPPAYASLPSWIVLTGGTALSAVLSWLFSTQARLRQEAEFSRGQIIARDAEITGLNRDLEIKITERVAELRTANEDLARFKAVIETTTDFVAMASLHGRTLYLNQAGRRMMEFPDDLVVEGREMSHFYPEDVNRFFYEVAIPQAMRDGAWSGETRLMTYTGREIPVSFVGTVVKSAGGLPLHLACIARDNSQREKVENELQRALAEEKELNRLKSSFISMVTHEIRTPLALILSSSEILSRYLARLSPEKRAEHLRTIDAAVERMNALVEDVLFSSKAEAGRLEFNPAMLDLSDFCGQLVDQIGSATNRRCPIELSVSGLSEPARADENLLRHIFANLLANAAKYSPPGAPVKFSVSREVGDAVFTVQDRGLGIPENDRRRLFTPFHRGKNVAAIHGTGLGLVIVKHCVERHGGSIEIESEEQAGTTARVRLPLFSPKHTEFMKRLQQTANE